MLPHDRKHTMATADVVHEHSDTGYQHVAKLVSPRPNQVRITTPISLHERIRKGFPRNWIVHFVRNLGGVPVEESLRVLNISERTYHRIKSENDGAPMDADQSARLWSFGEVLAKAEDVLGTREAALEWLRKKAVGLEGNRPLDLMETPQGAEIVKTLLDRMAYGVYA